MERIPGIGNVDVLEPDFAPEMNGTNSLEHKENDKTHCIDGNGVNGHTETNGHAETNGCTKTNSHAETNGHAENNSHAMMNGHAETNGHAVTNGYANMNGGKVGEAKGIIPKHADFNCAVCGGGQGGLAILGRLKAGGVTNCIAIGRTDIIGGI